MDISLATLQHWSEASARAVSTLNSGDFPQAFVDALGTLVRVESVMISLERHGRSPVLLYDRGIPLELRDRLINRYFSRGYMLDPFCLAVDSGLEEGFYHLSEIAPDDFFNSEYYRVYYLQAGSVEDCHYIFDVADGEKISICLFHGEPRSRYAQRDLDALRAVLPLVRELVLRHWGGIEREDAEGPPATFTDSLKAAFMNFGSSVLTERELEITHLILRGHSSKSAARLLNISPGTVREHRKNLYRKLDINSQAELFSLFIDAVSHYSEGDSRDPLENLRSDANAG